MTIAEKMREMLAAGVHFGHQKSKWNPKMKRFIHSENNGVHILDLGESSKLLEEAIKLVETVTSNGGIILFVGTKKQAIEIIISSAERADMPFVSNRWLGGTLTNWPTLSKRIERLKEIDEMNTDDLFANMTKKETVYVYTKHRNSQRPFKPVFERNPVATTTCHQPSSALKRNPWTVLRRPQNDRQETPGGTHRSNSVRRICHLL